MTEPESPVFAPGEPSYLASAHLIRFDDALLDRAADLGPVCRDAGGNTFPITLDTAPVSSRRREAVDRRQQGFLHAGLAGAVARILDHEQLAARPRLTQQPGDVER